MSATSPVPTTLLVPRSRAQSMDLAHTAYERFATVAASSSPSDWDRPTDCDGWDIRDLVGHVVGAMRSAASMREMLSQQREIKRRLRSEGGTETDLMTQVQIDRTTDLGDAELIEECQRLVERATRGRRRTPALLRRLVTFPVEMGSIDETWTLGYLVDVILTRDAWLHRIDLCRALDLAPELTAEHDGVIVADVVGEWARRHGQPYRLRLSGPAGGSFDGGDPTAATELELDAVEFCRTVSGRAHGDGLLATEVPF